MTGRGAPEEDAREKYNSVNIADEEQQKTEENERLKAEVQKERKLAFNACSILKMDTAHIGDFFFGKKPQKKEPKREEKKTFSEDEADDEGEEEESDEDYTLSKFYQSNTREELQNQLKHINFEDEDEGVEGEGENEGENEGVAAPKKAELLSGSEDEKDRGEKEFKVESGGRESETAAEGQTRAAGVDPDLFSSGNAQNFDFEAIIQTVEKESEECAELEALRKKSKEEINRNTNLEIEDENEDDDDLMMEGMGIKYDLLSKDEPGDLDIDQLIEDASREAPAPAEARKSSGEDEEFFNKFVEDILGKDEPPAQEKPVGNVANIRLGRRRRKRGSEEALDSQDVNDFLDEIAKLEKSEEAMAGGEEEEKGARKDAQKRDIYIQQRDQYFVDDEEVYLNELETDHCNWANVKSLFRVITQPAQELIPEESENRETVLNYFHDICKGLMHSRTEDFLSFVYSSPEVMDGLIRFGDHEGVQKVLSSVLNLYESVNNLNSFRFLKHRFGLYRRLLRSLIDAREPERVDQLAKIFVHLVKEKASIIDANYFIDKILLGSDNHVALLDKVVRESNAVLAELAALVVKRVVPEEERGFLEECCISEINKNFGRQT